VSFDRTKAYNDLPLLTPDVDIESKAVLKKAITANRALAELKAAGNLIPNQTILLRAIALQEAKLSSEIENIVTTNDQIYRAFSAGDGQYDPSTKEVLHYQEALWYGFMRLRDRPLGTAMFVEIANIIKDTDAGIRRTPGTKVTSGQKVIYSPPEGEAVIRDKLANLERFMHAEDGLDPLVKMAVAHYQFEAIHPFPDGNGRTGRIINILYLISQGLLGVPVLYPSKYIIEHKGDYYAGLRGVTEDGAWEPWILYMLEAVEQTALATSAKIAAIRALLDSALEEARLMLPKSVYSKELIELIFQQPYCRIRFVMEAGIAGQRKTASQYLKALEEAGFLSSVKFGREVLYLNLRLLEALSN
jgi:Fic family protein